MGAPIKPVDMHKTLHIFESNRALYEACISHGAWDNARRGPKWIDGLTKSQAEQWARYGCDAIVPAILPILDRFDYELTTPSYEWQSDVTGAFVNIGDYLAGDPQCMSGMHWNQSQLGTLNIGVCLESGCRACMNLNCLCSPVDAASYKIKGAAVMAFAAKMAAVRPVNLVAIHCSHGYVEGHALGEGSYKGMDCGIFYERRHRHYDSVNIVGVRVSTSPLDVGAAGFALCNIGFGRSMMYGLQVIAQRSALSNIGGCDKPGLTFPAITYEKMNERRGRMEQHRAEHTDPAGYSQGIMRALGWDATESIVIPATQDASLDNIENAIKWVRTQVERFNPATY